MEACDEACCSSAPLSSKEDLGQRAWPWGGVWSTAWCQQHHSHRVCCWMLEQLEQLQLSLGRCRKKVSASKRFTIHRASNVLTISLKRFGSCSSSGGRKITKVSAQRSTARAVSWPKVLPPEQGRRWSWCSHSPLLPVGEVGLILGCSSPQSLPGESMSPPSRGGTRSTAELLLLWQESRASS